MFSLQEISSKLAAGHRLNKHDLSFILSTNDIIGLGKIADSINRSKNHDFVTFHEHRYIRCLVQESANSSSYISRILSHAKQLITPTTKEIRLISIQPKRLELEILGNIISELKDLFPLCSIRGLSAYQVLQYSNLRDEPVPSILKSFKNFGLDALEGRAFKRSDIADLTKNGQFPKLPYNLLLEIHRQAHKYGIFSDATFSYGLDLQDSDEASQLISIRDLQDETGGFSSLIPLTPNLAIEHETWQPHLALNDLRSIAAARIFVDNIPRIKAPWGRLGINLAQLSLCFGANSLEGSLSNKNNSRIAGYRPFRSMNRPEVYSLVEKSGHKPMETIDSQSHINLENEPCDRSVEPKSLLYKLTKGARLDREEKLRICQDSHFLDLALCASDIKKGQMSTHQTSLLSSSIFVTNHHIISGHLPHPDEALANNNKVALNIDLGRPLKSSISLNHIKHTQDFYKQFFPHISLTILGIKGLWILAKNEEKSLEEISKDLHQIGCHLIESSSLEAEDDLTPSEIMHIHTILHQNGIKTVGKVELAAPYHGQGNPFWENFLDRIETFNKIQTEHQGILGINIESARGANISPVEYLRATAIARLFLDEIPNIITPIREFPLSNESKGKVSRYKQTTSLKLAPLATLCGSNDMGHFFSPSGSKIYCDQLKRVGITTYKRDNIFALDRN